MSTLLGQLDDALALGEPPAPRNTASSASGFLASPKLTAPIALSKTESNPPLATPPTNAPVPDPEPVPNGDRQTLGNVEISAAPQLVLWPSSATGRPSTSQLGSPSMMVTTPCPGSGQVTESPRRATGLPLMMTVGEALTTVPPCVVGSPRRMTRFMEMKP